MAFNLPLHDDIYTVPNSLIPDNIESQTPVRFHILPAAGADQARLKSLLVATTGLIGIDDWTPRMQEMVIKAFQNGGDLFTRTVEKIEGLTIPAKFAKRHMLAPPSELENWKDPKAPFPIVTGTQYSQIAGYWPVLSLAVAYEIQKLTGEAQSLDGRFFQQPSGSSSTETPEKTNSTARSAKKRRGARATAGSK